MSLSGLAGILGVAVGTYVGHAWFEFTLQLPMDNGVAVMGAAVLVSVWDAWEALARDSKSSHPTPSTRVGGVNVGASW